MLGNHKKTYNCTAPSVPSILKHFLYTCHVQSSYKMAPSRSTPAGIEIESFVTVGNIQHINILAWCELCIFRYKWLLSTANSVQIHQTAAQNFQQVATPIPVTNNQASDQKSKVAFAGSYGQTQLAAGAFYIQMQHLKLGWHHRQTCITVLMKAKPSHSRFMHQCNPLYVNHSSSSSSSSSSSTSTSRSSYFHETWWTLDWDPNSWAFQGQFHLSFSELAMFGLQISVICGLSLHDSTSSLSALAVSQHWIRGKSGK